MSRKDVYMLNGWKGLNSFAFLFLCLIILIGVFAPLIATSKPLYIKNNGQVFFPAFSLRKSYELRDAEGNVQKYPVKGIIWEKFNTGNDDLMYTLIPYDPGASDLSSGNFQPPFSKGDCPGSVNGLDCDPAFTHWFGTNLKGEDVLSGIIHGTTVSLKIGFFSMLLAFLIGMFFGIIAGYIGNETLKIPFISLCGIILVIIPIVYYCRLSTFFILNLLEFPAFIEIAFSIISICIITILFLGSAYLSGRFLHRLLKWEYKVYLPLDTVVSRFIDFFASVPKLMLVVALAAVLDRGVNEVILIIGISSWAGIARLVRAESQKVKSIDFITSSRALGLSHLRIILNHILPNIRVPLMVSFAFGVSGAILIESGLSFLNIGVPEDVITWGKLLADGRQNFRAPWLIVFPGLAIFITTLCLNVIGEKLQTKTR